jgi:hypothetical protein
MQAAPGVPAFAQKFPVEQSPSPEQVVKHACAPSHWYAPQSTVLAPHEPEAQLPASVSV